MNKRIALRIVQIMFVSIIALVLIGGLVRTYVFPKEINYYENRKANQPPLFKITAFLNSDFQSSLESALSDQVLRAETMKKTYNELESYISFAALSKIYDANPGKYFKYNDVLVFNSDYLLFEPRVLDDGTKAAFDVKADCINGVAKKYADIEFYAYYIEKDTDINFETGEKIGFYDYIEESIDSSVCKTGKYAIDSFDEFSERFYQTDHHWNNVGAYDGYLQVCELLGIEDVIEKGEIFTVADRMTGSKHALAKDYESWLEPMMAYKYNFPEMEITINKEPSNDYGNQNLTAKEFLKEGEFVSYGLYFGGDSGEVIFDTGRAEKDNVLIIGESYDNAILKLLASHFNKTYSVDLRNYEHSMGEKFDFDAYVKKHDIDKVLFIGNIDFYIMAEFNVGG